MIKQVFAAASFALGGAGVILVGYLSSNPLAFTHPVGELPTSTPIGRSLVDTPVAIDLDAPLVLPEVTISASLQRATRPAVADSSTRARSFATSARCSSIRKGATGVRRVRSLCVSDTNR
jgi:hypothetical protein